MPALPSPGLDERPLVVGILNLTPDSFHDGGRHLDLDAALRAAERMIAEGADWLDIGGESTRPGAAPVPVEEERRRVLPAIRALAGRLPISIDTRKPEVAEAALEAGASILNDVTGLEHPRMAELSAHAAATVVMHMRGEPRTMQGQTLYGDLLGEVREHLLRRAERARSAQVFLDPGLGFAKTAEQSALLLGRTADLVATGLPVLIGASRKSFLGALTGLPRPEDRLPASLAAAALAVQQGARALRVHDVGPTRQLVDVLHGVRRIAAGAAA